MDIDQDTDADTSYSDIVILMQGDTVNLNCSVADGDMTIFEWRKSNNLEVVAMDQVLTLNYTDASSVSQGGYYWCTITSMSAQLMDTAVNNSNLVLVVFHPIFTISPQPAEASEGDSVSFTCRAVGFPSPTIEWQVNNGEDELPSSHLVTFEDSSNSSSTLNITSVEYSDFGNYSCVATTPSTIPDDPILRTNVTVNVTSSSESTSGSASGLLPDDDTVTLTPYVSNELMNASLDDLTTTSNSSTLTGKNILLVHVNAS